MVRLPFSLLITSAIIVVVSSYFYRFEIMEWLYPREESLPEAEFALQLDQSARVYGILMFGFLGSVTMYVYSTLLTANGNLKQLNLVALSGIAVNFIVNALLVPEMQAQGAAIASLSTQLFTAGAYMLMAQRILKLKTNYQFIIRIILFAAIVVIFNLVSRQLSFHWLTSFCIMLAFSFMAAFTMKLINIMEMVRMVKERAG
jgi:O-antigen/teichoic acid export membrane protein